LDAPCRENPLEEATRAQSSLRLFDVMHSRSLQNRQRFARMP
jgi:hypothetical protein